MDERDRDAKFDSVVIDRARWNHLQAELSALRGVANAARMVADPWREMLARYPDRFELDAEGYDLLEALDGLSALSEEGAPCQEKELNISQALAREWKLNAEILAGYLGDCREREKQLRMAIDAIRSAVLSI